MNSGQQDLIVVLEERTVTLCTWKIHVHPVVWCPVVILAVLHKPRCSKSSRKHISRCGREVPCLTMITRSNDPCGSISLTVEHRIISICSQNSHKHGKVNPLSARTRVSTPNTNQEDSEVVHVAYN